MPSKNDKTAPGAVVDRSAEDAGKTAKKASNALFNDTFGAIALSTVAGYVDTSGFLALFGMFTAHVTGDLVTAAVLMVQKPDWAGVIRLAMIPIFMVVVALVTLFTRAIHRRGAATLAPLLFLMTIMLALFCLSGVYLGPYAKTVNDWAVLVIGGLGVAAMGVQNTLMRGALKSFSQTTVMTGNLTQFTIEFVEFLFPPKAFEGRERKRLKKLAAAQARKTGFPLLGFIVGSGGGAYLTNEYGLLSIALPVAILAILSLIAAIRSRRRRRS